MGKLIPILHNVTSPHRVVEFVTLAATMGFKTIVISKPSGAAAQMGVPQAFKSAVQLGANLIVLSDLTEVKHLLKISELWFVLSPAHAELSLEKMDLLGEGVVGLVFGGMEPGITVREASMGRRVHVGVSASVGPIALSAIALYLIRSRLMEGDTKDDFPQDQ